MTENCHCLQKGVPPMYRKLTAFTLSIVLIISLTACAASSGDPEGGKGIKNPLQGDKDRWVDSDLYESVSEDSNIRLQDDFAAAVNREWKLQIGEKLYSPMQEASDGLLDKEKRAVTDEGIAGVEAEKLRAYYSLASDWGYRNSQGIEPIKPYIEDIESISSMDELLDFIKDLKRNPLAAAPVQFEADGMYHSEAFPGYNLTTVRTPRLSLTDSSGSRHYTDLNKADGLEVYEEAQNKVLYMLGRLGYSEKEAAEIFRKCLIWEKKLDRIDDTGNPQSYPDDNAMTREDAIAKVKGFPLEDIMDAWGFTDTKAMVLTPRFAKKLSSVFRKSDLENIKGFLIVYYSLRSAKFLDREAYDTLERFEETRDRKAIETGRTDEELEDELIFEGYIGSSGMAGAMNQVYVENYFNDSLTEELRSETEDVIDAFKVIFKEEPWLTDEGKEACVEKLSSISINIAYQSFDVMDYSKVDFASKEEGGSFLEAWYEAERFALDHTAFVSAMPYRKGYWDPLSRETSTAMANAFYNPPTNSVYICAGVCEESIFSESMSYEEKLANLFTIVGHEITHGFDKTGSQYDKDGMRNDWLPYDDQLAFSDRTDKVAACYSAMTPFPGAELYDGSNVSDEATADMGGIRATLYLASGYPGFDYDKYFRSYASLWRVNVPEEVEKDSAEHDPHPLSFYRINVGLQQYDEFISTYGIKEGDGMYLPPDNRIRVW